jgi:tetratricopeptide (TPR) repeat protein
MFAFPFVVIFLVIFTFFLHRHDHTVENRREAFLAREHEANNTRRKDIENLDYIRIPLDSLPFDDNASDEILHLQDTIRKLADERILNLSAYTNTGLKLAYGAANLEALSQYDDNYTTLIKSIASWGEALMKDERTQEAVQVLEYGIRCKTHISSNYYTLARYYAGAGQSQQIQKLIAQAGELPSLMKDTIVSHLEEILSSAATT